jgi:Zn-dependent protease
MVIAAAGPASNLVLAVVAAILRALMPDGFLSAVLYLTIRVNVSLALFNMIPVPPLDGGNVLAGMMTGSMAETFDRLRPYGFLILYALMLTGALTAIILPPEALLLSWLL